MQSNETLSVTAVPAGRLVRRSGNLGVERPCVVCGALLFAKRSTRRTCSGRCRVALHRMRQSGVTVSPPIPSAPVSVGVDVPLW